MAETEETSHITSVRTQWRIRQLAAQKPHFKIVDGEFVQFTINPPADDLATTIANAAAAEVAEADIGQMIKGHGVFFGTWEPKDSKGNSLGKIFNVFAAPEDLTDDSGTKKSFKYADAMKRIANLTGFYGHNGESYENEAALYQALEKDTYKGGWILPTCELLMGTAANGQPGMLNRITVQPDNLFDHQNKGALKDTFKTAASGDDPDYHSGYWSCTEKRDYPSIVWNADFADGNRVFLMKDNNRQSCRPVRLEPRP